MYFLFKSVSGSFKRQRELEELRELEEKKEIKKLNKENLKMVFEHMKLHSKLPFNEWLKFINENNKKNI